MSDDAINITVELRRVAGPGSKWQASAIAGDEDGTELAAAEAGSPADVLEEIALTLDELEASAVMALESRAEDRLQDRGY